MSNLASGLTQLFVINQNKHDVCIPTIAWDCKSKYLATVGLNGVVYVFHRTGEQLFEFNLASGSAAHHVLSLCWDYLGDNIAVLQNNTQKVTLFNISTKKTSFFDIGSPDGVFARFSTKSSTLAVATNKGNLILYDVPTNSKTLIQGKHSRKIVDGIWTPASDNRDVIALISLDKTISVTDSNGQHVAQYGVKHDPIDVKFCMQKTSGAQNEQTLCISTVNKSLVLQPLVASTPPLELSFQEKYGGVVDFSWFGDGYVVVAFQNGYIACLSSHVGEIRDEVASLKLHQRGNSIVYNKALQTAFSVGDDGLRATNTRLWHQTTDLFTSFSSQQGEPVKLCMSPDEQILSVATNRGVVANYLLYVPILSAYNSVSKAILNQSSLQQISIVNTVLPSLNDKMRMVTNTSSVNSLFYLPHSTSQPATPVRIRKFVLDTFVEPTCLAMGINHVAVSLNDHAIIYNINLLKPHVKTTDVHSMHNLLKPKKSGHVGDMRVYTHPFSPLCVVHIPATISRIMLGETHIAVLGGDGILYVYGLLALAQVYKTTIIAQPNKDHLSCITAQSQCITSELRACKIADEVQNFNIPRSSVTHDMVSAAGMQNPMDVSMITNGVTDFTISGKILYYSTTDGILTCLDLTTGMEIYTYTHVLGNQTKAIQKVVFNKSLTRALFASEARWYVLNTVEDTITRVPLPSDANIVTALWDEHDVFDDTLFYCHSESSKQLYAYIYHTHGSHMYLHTLCESVQALASTNNIPINFTPHSCTGGIILGSTNTGTLQYVVTTPFTHSHALFNTDIIRSMSGVSPDVEDAKISLDLLQDTAISKLVDPNRLVNAVAECLLVCRPREAWLLLRGLNIDMSLFHFNWADYQHDGIVHFSKQVVNVNSNEIKIVRSGDVEMDIIYNDNMQYIYRAAIDDSATILLHVLATITDGIPGMETLEMQSNTIDGNTAKKLHTDRNIALIRLLLATEYMSVIYNDLDTALYCAQQLNNNMACLVYHRIRQIEDPLLVKGIVSMCRGDIIASQQALASSTRPMEAVYLLQNSGRFKQAIQLLKSFFTQDGVMMYIEANTYLNQITSSIATSNVFDQKSLDPAKLVGTNSRVSMMEVLGSLLAAYGEELEIQKDMSTAKTVYKECLDIRERLYVHYENIAKSLKMESLPIVIQEQKERSLQCQRALFGLSKAHIVEGDSVTAFELINKLQDQRQFSDCALLFEEHKQLREAAELYTRAGMYDKSALLFQQSKLLPKAKAIIEFVTTPKVHIIFAKAMEANGDFVAAYESYEKAEDIGACIRLLLNQLADPQKAFSIVRSTKHTPSAMVLAEYAISKGNFGNAVEFLVLGNQMSRARQLALQHNVVEEYMKYLGNNGTQEDYTVIAQYYIQQNDYLRAGQCYRLARDNVLSIRCFVQVPGKQGIVEGIHTCEKAFQQNDPEVKNMVAVLQEFIVNSQDKMEGEFGDEMVLLFKLYVAIREYVQAAATAIIISSSEQAKGNYVFAHKFLFTAVTDLVHNDVNVPIELSRALFVLHSYLVVKRWVKIGDHTTAALLLRRTGQHISKFPAHIVPILTSAIIETHRVGMKRTSSEFAIVVTRPELRGLINEKYKRKIEALARRPEDEEEAEPCAECPFCTFMQPTSSMDCAQCNNALPWCIFSGMHIVAKDASFCPHCRFPATYSLLEQAAQQNEACPMCAQMLNPSDIKQLSLKEVSDWLQTGTTILVKEKKTEE